MVYGSHKCPVLSVSAGTLNFNLMCLFYRSLDIAAEIQSCPSMSAFGINSLSSLRVAIAGSRVLRTRIEQDEASCPELHVSNEEVFWLQLRVIAFAHPAVGHGNFKQTMLTQQQNSSKENRHEFGRIWPDNVKTE